jgi:predicted AAA+ superfamily ATPase
VLDMMAKEVIKELIKASQDAIGQHRLVERDVAPMRMRNKVSTLTGVRRCGKSSLLHLEMQRLMANGIDRERMFYLQLEDERLEPSPATLTAITAAYQELYPGIPLHQVTVFLDELQGMPRWEAFVLRLLEADRATIYLSGSNSRMLSHEIATSLRGRTLNTHVLPFSYAERLRLRNVSYDPYKPKQRAAMLADVHDHLLWGGFPEVVQADERTRRALITEYFHVLLFRDLIERHGIQQPVVLKEFLKRMLASATKPTSIRKVHDMLRSAGMKPTKDLLYTWLEYALDVNLLIRCDRFGASANERLTSSTRFFSVDNGLLTAMTTAFRDEWGRLLENMVAVDAVRAGWQIAYYKDLRRVGRECDLLLLTNGRPKRAVQVCWDMSDPETRQRELKGLAAACQELGLKEGLVVTFENTEEIEHEHLHIDVVPYWRAVQALQP